MSLCVYLVLRWRTRSLKGACTPAYHSHYFLQFHFGDERKESDCLCLQINLKTVISTFAYLAFNIFIYTCPSNKQSGRQIELLVQF